MLLKNREKADGESYKKQEGGNEEKLKINKFWRAARRKEKQDMERKKEELHYLQLSQHCVKVECLGGT